MPRQMHPFLHTITRSLGAELWVVRCCRHLYWERKQVQLLSAFSMDKRLDKSKLGRLALLRRSMIGVHCSVGGLARAFFQPAARSFFATRPFGKHIVGKSA